MGRGSELIFFQRGHTNGQQLCEKMLNTTPRQGKMQIKTAMRYHLTPARTAVIKKINADEDVEVVNCCRRYGN